MSSLRNSYEEITNPPSPPANITNEALQAADFSNVNLSGASLPTMDLIGNEEIVKINNIFGTPTTLVSGVDLPLSTTKTGPNSLNYSSVTRWSDENRDVPDSDILIYNDGDTRWRESSVNLSVNQWRIDLDYTRQGVQTSRDIIFTLRNPDSSFIEQLSFIMPNTVAFQTFRTAFQLITIADGASIPLGYELSLRAEGENVVVNSVNLTRTTNLTTNQ